MCHRFEGRSVTVSRIEAEHLFNEVRYALTVLLVRFLLDLVQETFNATLYMFASRYAEIVRPQTQLVHRSLGFRRAMADLTLDNQILKEAAEGNF